MSIRRCAVRRTGKTVGRCRLPAQTAPVARGRPVTAEGTTTMRYLGYTLGDPSVPIPPPTPELMDQMGKFIEEATKAGVLVATGGLGGVDEAVKVRLADGKFTVLDG